MRVFEIIGCTGGGDVWSRPYFMPVRQRPADIVDVAAHVARGTWLAVRIRAQDDATALTYTATMNAPAFPHLIRSTLGRLLEAALARVVALDPEFVSGLATLEGRRLELVLSAPPIALSATVRDGRFAIGPATAETASDLTVHASPGALLAQLLPVSPSSSAPAGRITISGDAELARRLQQLVQRFDPDVEEAFSRVFGDVAGVQMARALKRGLDWSKRSASGFAQDAADYLTEENRTLVAKAELAAFHDDVDALRDDVDRFERRTMRARARLSAE